MKPRAYLHQAERNLGRLIVNNHSPHSGLWFGKYLLTLGCCLLASACRIVVPSPVEEAKLLEMGTFVSQTPVWVSQGAALNTRSAGPMGGGSFGFMPGTFSAPEQGGLSSFRNQGDAQREDILKQAGREKELEDSPKETSAGQEKNSPLERISKICPKIESATSDVLTTLNRMQRINKLESLVRQCRQSQDLWYWLAREHYALKKYAEAERCLDHSLAVDSSFVEAQDLLKQVRIDKNKENNPALHKKPEIIKE